MKSAYCTLLPKKSTVTGDQVPVLACTDGTPIA